MTEVGTLHREDTGALAVVKVVDPLGVGDVEIDPGLPLGFANAIESWLRDEHGYDYADVVAKSAGARAEGRKKLDMLGIADPKPRPEVRLEIQADTSAFDSEVQRAQRIISEMPDEAVVDGEIITIDDFAPAADEQLPGSTAEHRQRQELLADLDERARRELAHVEAAHEGTRTGRFRASRRLREEAVERAERTKWSDEWAAFRADAKRLRHDLTSWWPWRRS